MVVSTNSLRQHLKNFDFTHLFIDELGWDRHHTQPRVVEVEGETFTLDAVAEKRGFVVYVCGPDSEGEIPPYPTRRKIERKAVSHAREHLIIYVDGKQSQQIWQFVLRRHGASDRCSEHRFHAGQSGENILQRLQGLEFTLDEEEDLTIAEVAGRAQGSLYAERVTKRFYERFKTEHTAFLKFLKGIEAAADREWYASLMLNRLMFIYFVQKKKFLDGDADYLRNRLALTKQKFGKDKFYSFYRSFLLRLFHEGLNKPEKDRAKEVENLIGDVPYLNGGLFDVHDLERTYTDIQIPDKAFEKIFEFFDAYQWHLDDRPLRADNEINPDVLGYIFEKYINQKQMGAYYTKEDITGYIGRNTIIPYLFDSARKECPIAFEPEGLVWKLLRDDPDRYLYEAVRRGVVREDGSVIPESDLPEFVQKGMHDPKERMFDKRYNLTQAEILDGGEENLALPTETWREYVERRNRCLELRQKIGDGEITQINDLITYNLDICQFAEDVLINVEGPDLLKAFWKALNSISVLDPTCGSGAFLFAALNILEPLYSRCLEGMQGFIEDLELSSRKHHPKKLEPFKQVLDEVAKHPNLRYFILKSIVVDNLYGVDIMEEAVEICKLRLFLKLVSQVENVKNLEPLPDIDFNIRAGNTLVGFATLAEVERATDGDLFKAAELPRIVEAAEVTARAFEKFREMQVQHGMDGKMFAKAKLDLKSRLDALRSRLNEFLAGEYGIDPAKEKEYSKWLGSHQPFHWFVEFYGIMEDGGFDVIIGNPPYIAASQIRREYSVRLTKTARCTDIYAWVLERTAGLLSPHGKTGMIVPLSLGFSGDFDSCRRLLFEEYAISWFSSFGRIPSALFNFDVRVRNTIQISHRTGIQARTYTTRLHRWFDSERPFLFQSLRYAVFEPTLWSNRIPKVNTDRLARVFEQAFENKSLRVSATFSQEGAGIFFKKTAYNWLNFCKVLPPCRKNGNPIPHTEFGEIVFNTPDIRDCFAVLANGKLLLTYWFILGDDFHVTKWNYAEFPIDLRQFSLDMRTRLFSIYKELEIAMQEAVQFKKNAGKEVGNYNLAKCRHVTDQSDWLIANAIGIADAWDDIQLYYSQTVKTDFSGESNDGDE